MKPMVSPDFSQPPLLIDWDLHPFQLEVVHELNSIMPLGTDSPLSSTEASTGYLQDAVYQCKRRRLNSSPCDAANVTDDIQDFFQGFWDCSNFYEDPFRNFNFLVGDNSNFSAGDNDQKCSSQIQQQDLLSLPSSSQKEPTPENSDETNGQISRDVVVHRHNTKDKDDQQAKKRKRNKIVYPFAVIKPVGLEGDATLDDINERILMRPTRPVKHPVGEFACGPRISADGPGLSGKAVVGLTRIHTPGKGTITIIRTRG